MLYDFAQCLMISRYLRDALFHTVVCFPCEFQRDSSRDRTDIDVIRENHRFLWDDDEDSATSKANMTWDALTWFIQGHVHD